MTAVRKSLAYTALDSYIGLVLQIASTVIIARVLTPAQVGVFAVAAVFATLASSFRDFGVAEYLIQEKELTDDMIRASMTVNIAVSWAMGLLLFGLSPLAADFYREPGVGAVMRVQAVSFLLIPFGAVTMAWFRRNMNFKPLFVSGLLANTTSFAVSVTLALRGHGYMSLAWSSLAGVVVTVAVSMWMRPAGFPRWPGRRGIRRVVDFGKFASGIYVFGQLGKGAPEMIIGRAMDMAAVGMFSRAYGLVEVFHRLVLRATMPVCLPYLARSTREQGTPLPGLLRTMSYLTAVGWSFLLFMGVASYAVVRLMYGSQWMQAVPLAKIVCAAAALELLYYPAKEALLAVGRVRESSALQLRIQVLRILGLLAVVPWGLPGACWGLLVAAALGAWQSHVYLARWVGLGWRDVFQITWRNGLVAAAAVSPVIAWALWTPIGEHNYVAIGIGGGLACTVMWLLALRASSHALWDEVARLARAGRGRLGL